MRTIRLFLILSVLILTGCASAPQPTAPTAAEKVAWGDRALRVGDESSALKHYMSALLLDDQDCELFYKVGTLEKRRGNKRAAIASYRRVVDLEPDHMPAIDGLAMLLIERNNTIAAKELVQRMQELQPNSWRVPYAIGLIALTEHEFGRAEYHFTKSLEKSPNNPEVLMRRGRAHLLNNRYEEAQLDLTGLLKNPRYKNQAHQNLGILYLKRREYTEALDSFLKTAKPTDAYTNVGQAAKLQGDWRDAEFYLREAIRVSPTYNVKAAEQLEKLAEDMKSATTGNQAQLQKSRIGPEVVQTPKLGTSTNLRISTRQQLYVLSGRERNSRVVGMLVNGSKIELLDKKDGWTLVEFFHSPSQSHRRGWILTSELS